ncbi:MULTISPECIES: SDR family NAD(P)-dependent oxidoreductase [Bacillus cereus group]|uniref:SDR family NAD(P)-dependent oxidoreductase n=1 Tax=Bacillus cereus group TaxID=86661 RepID=UPI0008643CA0|nr:MULTISPECIES: SDR family NAD(P)-dependent oxidoreductase [Bacillus cereus group]MDH2860373.1 SDR family oxidoreductase [Bacillus cytotoxicus]MDH2868035.1 SDR family oxidoreductase [Bacillus cytotoxicus]MDH2872488.1 SDR family oxidoreductase [Bacillus cytotoxicus]MDH2875551.1 SDR family oxidoreductase [Bacillus cytotoxicus]MDH2888291.1 SDR family oxidoreductase [Bacillus cytotoxicus]
MKKKAIVVAGGASGIGFELMQNLLKNGFHVINLDKNKSSIGQVERYVEFIVDLNDPERIKGVVQKLVTEDYEIEGLAIIAGIGYVTPFFDLSPVEFKSQVNDNLQIVFNVCYSVIPFLISTASIVTVGSTSVYGFAGSSVAYAAAKAGVIGLTKSLAHELGGRGIRVNCVIPGAVDTPLLKKLSTSTERNTMARFSALGKIAKPDQVAKTIYFLLGGDSAHITGQTLVVDGGLSLAYRPAYM